jgi:hypothetical protein
VPTDVKGNVKLVGLLPGWPFEVKLEPTVTDPKATSTGVLQLLQKVIGK